MAKSVKFKCVAETVDLLSKKIKADKIQYLAKKTKDGIRVGEYNIISDDDGLYHVHFGDKVLYEDINLLETALLVIELCLTKKKQEICVILKCDKEFIKYKNDAFFYNVAIQQCRQAHTFLVYQTRYQEARFRMIELKYFISSKRIINNIG